jgi:hypothetical protein
VDNPTSATKASVAEKGKLPSQVKNVNKAKKLTGCNDHSRLKMFSSKKFQQK